MVVVETGPDVVASRLELTGRPGPLGGHVGTEVGLTLPLWTHPWKWGPSPLRG